MIKIHILEILDRMGMSQIELSSRTGIRPATVNQLFHEEIVRLNLNYLSKLCEVLNCEVGDILEYIPDPKQTKKPINGNNMKR